MKEFVVKDETAYKLSIKSKKCLRPNDLNHLEFIQECKNKDGEVDFTSTYQFFLTDDEIKILARGLTA